jgi:lipopolysaccharide export system permease protein
LLAIPLSKTNPRQGRFARMLPAVLLYVIYLVILNAARGAVEDGKISSSLGLWWVHALFLFIALTLLFLPVVRQRLKQNKTFGAK